MIINIAGLIFILNQFKLFTKNKTKQKIISYTSGWLFIVLLSLKLFY